MFGKFAHLMYRRRKAVVGAWVVILILSFVGLSQLPKVLGPPDFSVSGSESKQVGDLLNKKLHQNDDKLYLIAMVNRKQTVNDASFKRSVNRVAAKIRSDRSLRLQFLDNPIVSHNPQGISKDKHAVLLTLSSALKEQGLEDAVPTLRDMVKTPGFTTYVTGSPAANYDSNIANKDDLSHAESVTVPILLVILLLVFGTAVAAAIPLLVAFFAIILGLAMVATFGHGLPVSIFVTNVVTVIGTGLAIDYSLFILYRFREELKASNGDTEFAVVRTMETTGRAIFVSGIIVALALATLMLTGLPFMVGMGLGGVIVPVSSLLVGMTLLPAVLGLLGPRVNRLRVIPARFLTIGGEGGGMWHRIAGVVMAKPIISLLLVTVIMLALAFPITKLNFASGSQKNQPQSLESVAGFLYVQSHFNTQPNPVQVVVQRQGSGTLLDSSHLSGIRALVARLKQDPEAASVNSPTNVFPANGTPSRALLQRVIGRTISTDRRTMLITVAGKDDAGTTANRKMVERFRDVVAPRAIRSMSGTKVLVGGRPGGYLDFDVALFTRFPYILAFVLLLAYVFLFFAFESLLLPLKAVLLNLLSVGAAYGLLQIVFQRGVGSSLLGFTPESGVASWVPVFLFAFLFGLSMDYEVFLLSRIREAWLRTNSNRQSVALGLERTGRLITSAAFIMVVAFGGFMLGKEVQFKEFGFGLVASVLIDATLVRVILVPSIMELTGEWNWWLPAALRGFVQRVGLAEVEAPAGHMTPQQPVVAGAGVVGDARMDYRTEHGLAFPADGPAGPSLSVIGGGTSYPLRGTVRVGRSSGNDVVLNDPSISRRHAIIIVRGREVLVRDVSSSNGTMVNGDWIKGDQVLRSGDIVAFGDMSFVYQDGEAEPAT